MRGLGPVGVARSMLRRGGSKAQYVGVNTGMVGRTQGCKLIPASMGDMGGVQLKVMASRRIAGGHVMTSGSRLADEEVDVYA